MSIEGLWSVDFGLGGGIAVLESGRVFGGDSWFAYTGQFQLNQGSISGRLTIKRHNPDPSGIDVWGTGANLYQVDLNLTVSPPHDAASGVVTRVGVTGAPPLPVTMKKLSDLP